MAGEADIWQPRTLLEVTADTKTVTQRITATQDQLLFVLSDFAYAVGTGALQVYKNGSYLTPATEFVEQTDTTFSLVVAADAGDQIVAVGNVGISGTVDVRDTDIFETNYQALRDYAGVEDTIYAQGKVTKGDGEEAFFQLQTGAAPGTYVDDNLTTIVPTGGDGSSAWIRSARDVEHNYDTLAAVVADVTRIINDNVLVLILKERVATQGGGFTCDVIDDVGNALAIASGQTNIITLTTDKSLQIRVDSNTTPMAFGYNTDATAMTSAAIVDANWDIMKSYIAYMNTNNIPINYRKIKTMQEFYADWISGTDNPVGFYSDSTTDGTGTAGHVASTSSDSAPFAVAVNESPAAYPALLESLVTSTGPAKTAVNIYNGGFDGKSFIVGDKFGLKHWYNVWFRGLSGSNVDWSDVAGIVIGFGISDSANDDDTAAVIRDFGEAVECVINDCFLRGVQPILQTPNITLQHYGASGAVQRNGNEILTIINSVHDGLAQKYNLEILRYGETELDALNNFTDINYDNIVSGSDLVHPNDLGHRLHASWLLTNMNNQIPFVGRNPLNLFAGSPLYKVSDESMDLIGDKILTWVQIEQNKAVESNNGYYYKFPPGIASATDLVEVSFFVTEPSVLFVMPIDDSLKEPDYLVRSETHDTDTTISAPTYTYSQPDVFINESTWAASTYYADIAVIVPTVVNGYWYQPQATGQTGTVEPTWPTGLGATVVDGTVTWENMGTTPILGTTYTKAKILSNLSYGLNTVTVKTNSTAVHKFGGLLVVPTRLMGDYDFMRTSSGSGTIRARRVFDFKSNLTTERWWPATSTTNPLWMRYNFGDDVLSAITFKLTSALVFATSYDIHCFYNDHLNKFDCYNIINITGDTVNIYNVTDGVVSASVGNVTSAGLNALLVAGAFVEIRIKPNFASGTFTNISINIDNVVAAAINVTNGDMWTQGYGLYMNSIYCTDINVTSIELLSGDRADIK